MPDRGVTLRHASPRADQQVDGIQTHRDLSLTLPMSEDHAARPSQGDQHQRGIQKLGETSDSYLHFILA